MSDDYLSDVCLKVRVSDDYLSGVYVGASE